MSKSGPALTTEQKEQLLTWLAAEYSGSLIRQWFAERNWPEVSDATLSYHRKKHKRAIEAARAQRHASALNVGLALREERVQRLKEHADRLEAIKWVPGEGGRLWNEKAWREVLDDIAREVGHRRQGVDLALRQELDAFLDRLRDAVPDDIYAQILTIAAGGGAPGE